MNDISPGLRARVLLEKHGFQTAHALGQNFLLDENLLSHLIDLSGVAGEDESPPMVIPSRFILPRKADKSLAEL